MLLSTMSSNALRSDSVVHRSAGAVVWTGAKAQARPGLGPGGEVVSAVFRVGSSTRGNLEWRQTK